MTVTDRTAEPAAVFEARLAGMEAAPTVDIAADVAVAAGQAAVRDMPFDWYCPKSTFIRRHECRECVAEIAVAAALAAMPPADEAPTSVDQLTREHFGWWVDVPSRQAAGYLYAVHDDFHDGYPARTLTLVGDDGGGTEEEFTDHNPASFPKTMSTPCTAVPDRPAISPDQLALDGSR